VSDSSFISCLIRKEAVAALPEEIVRQQFLSHMIMQKGFPASLIAIEQSLKQLPHLTAAERLHVPKRRADIICYARSEQSAGLHPLLIVECKSIKISSAVMNQIVGYNHFVRSHFIAIVNHEEIRTGWYDSKKKDYLFVNFLPSYSDLLEI
jgi:hypothetical protein